MKIAQIVCAFPPYAGGIGQSAYRLGEILSQEHQVKTFSLKPQQLGKAKTQAGEQKVVFLDPKIRFGHGALPFFLPFRLFQYDILYLHYPFFGVDALILWWHILRPKQKLVIHYHMDTPALLGFKKILALPSRIIRPLLLRRAVKIIVASEDYAQQSHLAKIKKHQPYKIKSVPFGVETEIFKPKIQNNHNSLLKKANEIVEFVNKTFIKKGSHSLLFVGGLDEAHYFKGLPILLKALSQITLPFQLNIIGDGSLRADYEQQVVSLQLTKKVKFLGRVSEEDLIRTYQQSDLLLLPSVNSHEAFGLVLIEAMACGVPVIASNLPGVRSVFRDGQEGLLCQPGDVNDLIEKIEKILSDENKRQAMSKAARKLAEEKYAWNKVADAILDEFSNLK